MRRLLILLLFGLVLAGGAAVAWQARGQARLVQRDLTTARSLLARAGGFQSGKLEARLRLIDQAQAHTLGAQRRLGGWPLRPLGMLPLAGRDVRVARAVATAATGTVTSTRKVVTALQPLQTRPPDRTTILDAAEALEALRRPSPLHPAGHRRGARGGPVDGHRPADQVGEVRVARQRRARRASARSGPSDSPTASTRARTRPTRIAADRALIRSAGSAGARPTGSRRVSSGRGR